jgi:hypothetical protein
VRAWAIKVIVNRSLNKLYYDVKKNNKKNTLIVDSIKIGLRVYRLRFSQLTICIRYC